MRVVYRDPEGALLFDPSPAQLADILHSTGQDYWLRGGNGEASLDVIREPGESVASHRSMSFGGRSCSCVSGAAFIGWDVNVDMEHIITSRPLVMHGEPCFAGTRVAVWTFFDHLEAGYTVTGFLEQFPTVRPEQVAGLLAELRAVSARAAGTTG